jgi:hypothetical protein
MKKIIFYTILLTIMSGCIKEDKMVNSYFNITNHSDVNIALVPYSSLNIIYDSILIKPNENFVISEQLEEGLRFQLGEMNRAIIIFNDSIFYTVYRDSLSKLPSGNILKLEDWSGGKIDEYHYEYEFNFTDADYLEALKQQ